MNFIYKLLHVQQLDGSITPALGFGLKLIQHHHFNFIIPLWPVYYMPNNQHCTFFPTALKHYLKYQTVYTTHLQSLYITTPCGNWLIFLSISHYADTRLLDFHQFTIVKPTIHLHYIPRPIVNKAYYPVLTRAVVHQRL